jgi:hypothetical protein
LQTFFSAVFGLDTGFEGQLSPQAIVSQTIGSLLYGSFHIVTVILLINMLIAMMTKSYERIRVKIYHN